MLDSNCFGRKSTFYGFSRSVLRVRTVNEIPAPQESQNHPARRSRNSNDPIQKASSSWAWDGRRPCCGCCTSRLFVTVVGTRTPLGVGTHAVVLVSCDVTLVLTLSAELQSAVRTRTHTALRTVARHSTQISVSFRLTMNWAFEKSYALTTAIHSIHWF